MGKKEPDVSRRARLLVLVDESNVGSSVRTAGRGLDWLRLRAFLAGPESGRELIEMVVYAGLPPPIPLWQDERDKKNKFIYWLRSNGFMVVTKDGAPAEEGHYKANVDVMMAIDALELSVETQPDVVILVTGDADFAYLATKLRRRGIRVEVASVTQNLGSLLSSCPCPKLPDRARRAGRGSSKERAPLLSQLRKVWLIPTVSRGRRAPES